MCIRDRLKDAEAAAKARLEKAEKDSEVYVERSSRTLEQAARDLLIGVGQAIENIIQEIVSVSTDQALDPDTLKRMMVKMAEAYAEKNGAESRIAVSYTHLDVYKRQVSIRRRSRKARPPRRSFLPRQRRRPRPC